MTALSTDRADQAILAKQSTKIYESAVNGSYSMIRQLTPENVKQISREAVYEEKLEEYKNWFFYFTE